METTQIEHVLSKVLQKLDRYVDTVETEKLSPQAMKHLTGTLKDIRDLTDQPTAQGVIHVEFDHPEWKE
ncbi:MAG: hypothetical protein IJZ56_01595 [Oscillospiraceae bacterium]|nr:hypothetical protein [Oscillospiraceae bacterium]